MDDFGGDIDRLIKLCGLLVGLWVVQVVGLADVLLGPIAIDWGMSRLKDSSQGKL